MVRYFYAVTPLFIIGTVVLLSLPWLGLIALVIVTLVALSTLAFAMVFVPLMLVRSISARWHGSSPQTVGIAPRTTHGHAIRKGYVS